MSTAILIAERVADNFVKCPPQEGDTMSSKGSGFGGTAGLALLFETVATTGNESRDWPALAHSALKSASSVASPPLGLYVGVCGWLAVAKLALVTSGRYSKFVASVQDAIGDAASKHYDGSFVPRFDGDVDLVRGMAGVYIALAMPPAWQGAGYLRSQLAALLSNPQRMKLETLQMHGRSAPQVNLGIAHGLPGVLGAYVGGAPADKDVIKSARRFLLHAALERDGNRCWPLAADSKVRTRSAWCYGTPGVIDTLLTTASEWGTNEERLVNDFVAATNAEDLRQLGVVDHCFCHGTAGLAWMSWRVWRRTMDPKICDVSKRLRVALIEGFDPDLKFGYATYDNPSAAYVDDDSFLTGASGVAIAMLSMSDASGIDFVRLVGLAN